MIDEYLVLASQLHSPKAHDHARLQELRVRNPIASPPPPTCSASWRQGGDFRRRPIVEGKGSCPRRRPRRHPHGFNSRRDVALVMGLASDKPVKVDDTAFIATSFPGFHPDDALDSARSLFSKSASSGGTDGFPRRNYYIDRSSMRDSDASNHRQEACRKAGARRGRSSSSRREFTRRAESASRFFL